MKAETCHGGEQTLGSEKKYSGGFNSASTLLLLPEEKCKALWSREIIKPQIQVHEALLLQHNDESKPQQNLAHFSPKQMYTMECG